MKIMAFIMGAVVMSCAFVLPHWNLPEVDIGNGDGSVQVYYINLNKAVDRRNAITSLLNQLDLSYKRIAAVYGKELSQSEKDEVTDGTMFKVLMGKGIVDGEIGCYLSHLKTWKEFLKSKASYALIIEDDATFNPAELKAVVDELIEHNDKWDYVNLDPHRSGNGRIVHKISDKFNLIAPKQRVWLTTCQLINRKAAASLIKHALPIRMPVDHYVYRSWELGYKFRIVSPNAAGHGFGGSYIGSEDYSEKWYLKLTQQINRMISGAMCHIMAYMN